MEPGIVAAAAGALLFGSYLYLIKHSFSDYPASVAVFMLYASALVWYLPVGLLTVDGGYVPSGFGETGALVLAATVGGTLVGLVTSFRALAAGDVSYVAPISKIIPVFVLPLEVLLLHQHLSALQVLGVVVATVAIYVANYEPGELIEPLRRAAQSRPAQLALASAASFAVVDVGKRTLMQEVAMTPQTYLLALFVALPVGLAPVARRHWPARVRDDLPKFVAVGLLVAAANHVTMVAFQTLPASVASPVVNTQAVVAVLLGGVFLDEDYFRIRVVAAALAVAGVTTITLG